MNKRGFHFALSFPRLFFPFILLFYILHVPQTPYSFFLLFFLVLQQVSHHLPFAQLSLTSLSSTPLHYEVQLKITARQIIFILLELLKCIKIYFAINLVAC